MSANSQSETTKPSKLLFTFEEAAEALSIGTRTLWSMKSSGEIPYVQIRRRVLFPVDSLKEWITKQQQGGAQ